MFITLDGLTAPQLVAIYNQHAEKPVDRFSSRADGAKRLRALLERIEVQLEEAFYATFPEELDAARDAAFLASENAAEEHAGYGDKPEADEHNTEPDEASVEAVAIVPAKAPTPGGKDDPAADAPAASGKVTAKARILAMILRPNGATEGEVCADLGWAKAGATIGRAIKVAPFTVRKEKDGSRTRYFADHR